MFNTLFSFRKKRKEPFEDTIFLFNAEVDAGPALERIVALLQVESKGFATFSEVRQVLESVNSTIEFDGIENAVLQTGEEDIKFHFSANDGIVTCVKIVVQTYTTPTIAIDCANTLIDKYGLKCIAWGNNPAIKRE